MSTSTFAEGRTCEACGGPVADDYVPNCYDLYGYCWACVALVGDDPDDDDEDDAR